MVYMYLLFILKGTTESSAGETTRAPSGEGTPSEEGKSGEQRVSFRGRGFVQKDQIKSELADFTQIHHLPSKKNK